MNGDHSTNISQVCVKPALSTSLVAVHTTPTPVRYMTTHMKLTTQQQDLQHRTGTRIQHNWHPKWGHSRVKVSLFWPTAMDVRYHVTSTDKENVLYMTGCFSSPWIQRERLSSRRYRATVERPRCFFYRPRVTPLEGVDCARFTMILVRAIHRSHDSLRCSWDSLSSGTWVLVLVRPRDINTESSNLSDFRTYCGS